MRRPEYWSWILSATAQNDPENEPSPYVFASSFYGPGVILAWYFIYISFLIKFVNDTDNRRPGGNIRLSADLAALLLYPAIAGGHLLVRLAHFPVQERGKLIVLLADMASSPGAPDPDHVDKFSSWDGGYQAAAPTVEVLQHAVAVEGPVRILQNFWLVSTALLIVVCLRAGSLRPVSWLWGCGGWWRHTGPTGWLWFVVYWWTCIVLFILLAVGGGSWVVMPYLFLMSSGHFLLLFWVFCTVSTAVVLPVLSILALVGGQFAGAIVFAFPGAVVLFFAQYLPAALSATIVPDTGVSLWELDQIATAIGGAAGLAITVLLDTPEGQQAVKKMKTWWRETVTEKKGQQRGAWSRNSVRWQNLPLHLVRAPEQGQLGRVNTV